MSKLLARVIIHTEVVGVFATRRTSRVCTHAQWRGYLALTSNVLFNAATRQTVVPTATVQSGAWPDAKTRRRYGHVVSKHRFRWCVNQRGI